MAVGVFGKLPARRDYVRHRVDAPLMEIFDPWLQRAVAESRRELGPHWLDHYLTAPILRFWIGSRIAGGTVLGALMPSVDGIGRYFPLCALGTWDMPVAPPEVNEHAEWFEAVEAQMLTALGDDGSYEVLTEALDALPAPTDETGTRTEVAKIFATLRCGLPDDAYDRLSCWWVPSPDRGATPPRAVLRFGMPAPVEYAALIAQDRVGEPSPALGGA